MASAQVFLSAVSAEFRSYRDALRHALDAPNVSVKVQEDFIATGTATLDKLDTYIRQCDAVIHLVGDMTGAVAREPSVTVISDRYPDLFDRLPALAAALQSDTRVSYTQWEAWLALYHRKLLIIAVPASGAPRETSYRFDDVERAAQQAHLSRLSQEERNPEIRFENADRLALNVLRSGVTDVLRAATSTMASSGMGRSRFAAPSSAWPIVGRQNELAWLQQSLSGEDSRVVTLFGPAGSGKTALAAEACRGVSTHFARIRWVDLRDGPDARDILWDCLVTLAGVRGVDTPGDFAHVADWLTTSLDEGPTLLVLDNFESVVPPESGAAVSSSTGDPNYFHFLDLVSRRPGPGRVVITTRHHPTWLVAAQNYHSTVESRSIKGLDLQGQRELLAVWGVPDDPHTLSEIDRRFAGNPLALRIFAAALKDTSRPGELPSIEPQSPGFDSVNPLLDPISQWIDDQITTLSDRERDVLDWLAILRLPSTALDIWHRSIRARTLDEIIGAAEVLRRKSLVDTPSADPSALTLQPVIMRHVEGRLIRKAADEIGGGVVSTLQEYPLYQATALEHVRTAQRSLLLLPTVDLLLRASTREGLIEQLRLRLDSVRNLRPGYAAGNILNLLFATGANLSGCDLSDLWIREADLRNTEAVDTRLARCHFQDCQFGDVFDTVLAVAIHPGGHELAAAGVDGTVRAWSLPDTLTRTMYGTTGHWVRDLAYEPSGRYLASTGDDGCVRLWGPRGAGLLATFQTESRSVRCLTFVGQRHLVAGSAEGVLHVWDLETRTLSHVMKGHEGHVRSVASPPAGGVFVSGGDDATVRVWSLDRAVPVAEYRAHGDRVRAVAFSLDGRHVASGAADRKINVWNVETGRLVQSLVGHTQWVSTVVFCGPTGWLASAGGDKTVRIWNIDTGECIHTLAGHTRLVWSVASSPDGRHLVSGGDDQSVRVWDLVSARCLHILSGRTGWVTSIAPLGSTRIAVGRADRTIRILDGSSNRAGTVLRGHEDWVTSVAASGDASVVVSGSDDGTIRVWDVNRAEEVWTLRGHTDRVRAVALASDSRVAASGGHDRVVKLWSLPTSECLATLTGHDDWIRCVAFGASDDALASGSDDQTIRLWSVSGRRCIGELRGHSSVVRALVFAGRGRYLISGSNDRSVRVWDWATRNCIAESAQHTKAVLSVAVSPDGAVIASGGEDGTVRLWHATGGPASVVLSEYESWVTSVVFMSDVTLVSGSQDGSVRVWDLVRRRLVKTLTERPFSGMILDDVSGLDQGQRAALSVLGARRAENRSQSSPMNRATL